MDLLTQVKCPGRGCSWNLDVGAAPTAPGYLLQRVPCRSRKCKRRWLVLTHVTIRPTLVVRIAGVAPDQGGRMDVFRAGLLRMRDELNAGIEASRIALPPLTDLDVSTMLSVAAALTTAQSPVGA